MLIAWNVNNTQVYRFYDNYIVNTIELLKSNSYELFIQKMSKRSKLVYMYIGKNHLKLLNNNIY